MAEAKRQIEPVMKTLSADERFEDIRIDVQTMKLGRIISVSGTVSSEEDLKDLEKLIEGKFSKEYQVWNRVSVESSEMKP